MAWQRSTGLHAGRPSPIAAMLGGMQGDGRQKPSHKQNGRSEERCGCAFDSAVAVAVAWPWTLDPLKRAEHRRPWRTGSEGGEAGAEAFSPRHGWRVEKPRHGREAQGIGSRFCFMRSDAAPGARFFGYFLFAEKKVTRATARNSAPKAANNSED